MVFSDQVMLVASNTTVCPDKITLTELPNYPLIWSSQLHCVQRALNAVSVGELKLNILFNLDSLEAVKLAAIRGHGLAFLPYMSIKKSCIVNNSRSFLLISSRSITMST